MTNEQAIKILKNLQIEFNENYIDYSGVNEAYNLAIRALEFAESQRICCDNCVNRNYKSKEACTSPYGQCEFFEDETQ